jgi:hypothetical protein
MAKYRPKLEPWMIPPKNELAELASINLAFAQAEIATIGDRESILRALDHIGQAKASLRILAKDLEVSDDAEEEAA